MFFVEMCLFAGGRVFKRQPDCSQPVDQWEEYINKARENVNCRGLQQRRQWSNIGNSFPLNFEPLLLPFLGAAGAAAMERYRTSVSAELAMINETSRLLKSNRAMHGSRSGIAGNLSPNTIPGSQLTQTELQQSQPRTRPRNMIKTGERPLSSKDVCFNFISRLYFCAALIIKINRIITCQFSAEYSLTC